MRPRIHLELISKNEVVKLVGNDWTEKARGPRMVDVKTEEDDGQLAAFRGPDRHLAPEVAFKLNVISDVRHHTGPRI